MASIARAVRIGRGQKAAEAAAAAAVAPELFQQSEETALHDAYQQAAAQVGNALSETEATVQMPGARAAPPPPARRWRCELSLVHRSGSCCT